MVQILDCQPVGCVPEGLNARRLGGAALLRDKSRHPRVFGKGCSGLSCATVVCRVFGVFDSKTRKSYTLQILI